MNTVRDLKEALKNVPDEYVVPRFVEVRIVPAGGNDGLTMTAVYLS